MADLASSTITISAPPDEVMAVIADVDRYPDWTGQIKSAEVLDHDEQGHVAGPVPSAAGAGPAAVRSRAVEAPVRGRGPSCAPRGA